MQSADAILNFIRVLREEGFALGVEECLRASRILAAGLPSESLASRLVSVFAKNEQQWYRFFELYQAHFAAPAVTAPMNAALRSVSVRRNDRALPRLLVSAFLVLVGVCVSLYSGSPIPVVKSVTTEVQSRLGQLTKEFSGLQSQTLSIWIGTFLACVVLLAFYVWLRRPATSLSVTPASSGPVRTHFDSLDFLSTSEGSRLATDMRRLQPNDRQDFDLQKTIAAAIRIPGFPRPLTSRSRSRARYLVLIDRRYPGDHLAILLGSLMDKLRAENVQAAIYFFSGDPRICRSYDGPSTIHLRELSSLWPDSRLVIFADAEAFFDTVDGRAASWISLFANWSGAYLFAPPMSTTRKRVLSEWFEVFPATVESFREAFSRDPQRRIHAMEIHEPLSKADVDGLRDQLGPDLFRWVCACAVYPRVQYDLTVFLGERLLGPHRMQHRLLDTLCQLSWFRSGLIPSEIRAALFKRLSGDERDQVAQLLVEFFEGSAANQKTQMTSFPFGVTTASKQGPYTDKLLIKRAYDVPVRWLGARSSAAVRVVAAATCASGVFLLVLDGNSALNSAAKLVDAAGKGPLSLVAFLVLVLAFLIYRFFARERLLWRGVALSVMIACIFAFIFILAVPKPKASPPVGSIENTNNDPSQQPQSDPNQSKPNESISPPVPVPVTLCPGSKELVFRPQDPGVMPVDSSGHHIALGDGGGGTTLEKWVVNWTAPGTVTNVYCTVGGFEHILARNKDGKTAECIGSINGGNDAIVMHVSWEAPCQ